MPRLPGWRLLLALGSVVGAPGCGDPAAEDLALVAEENDPISSLAVDATDVYFASGFFIGGGPVQRIPKAGGDRATFGAGEEFAKSLRLDATAAYWVDATTGQITFAAKDGSAFGRHPTTGQSPVGLALYDDALYWTAVPPDPAAPGSISRMTKNGTGSTQLASGQKSPRDIVVDSRDVYWVNEGTWPSADGALVRIAKTGGAAPVVLADRLTGPNSVVLDDGNAYFSVTGPDDETQTGAVMRIPKGGGAPVVLADAHAPYELAVDGGFVYAATARGVLKVPVNGGQATIMGRGPARHVAVDGAFVYFGSEQYVYRIPK